MKQLEVDGRDQNCPTFNSLISDFFPTPRTILKISVNLMRFFFFFFFFEGDGVGVLEYNMALKWQYNAPFATTEAKKFLGEDPQTPL